MVKQTALDHLIDVHERLALLQEEEKVAKEMVLKEMQKEHLDKVKTDRATISIARRPYYTYTDAVKKLEDKVKLKKIEEQEKGIAEEKLTEYLLIKFPKQ